MPNGKDVICEQVNSSFKVDKRIVAESKYVCIAVHETTRMKNNN